MRNFKLGIHRDARPQATFLLTAAALSILLWFIPFAEVLTYPFRLFVTFIHEGGHALAALVTGNSVESLSIATNASGETYTTQGGLIFANAGIERGLHRFDDLWRGAIDNDSQGDRSASCADSFGRISFLLTSCLWSV